MSIKYAKISQGTKIEPGLIQVATIAEALAGTNEFKAITPALLESKLAQLIDSAPGALDTLNELAAAINDDANFSTTIAAQITNLQNQISSLSGGGASNQIELDNTQSAAGLATNGDYIQDSTTNFLGSATSLANADFRLDAQIKTNADDIASLGNGSFAALQAEVDAVEGGVGLSTAGAHVARSGTNYLDSATTIAGEITLLDTQVDTNESAISTNASNLSTEITNRTSGDTALQTLADAHESAIGLSTAGAYESRSGTNFLDSASSIVGEITALDTAVQANVSSLATKATATALSALDTRVSAAESDIDAEEVKSADFESRLTTLEGGSSTVALQNELDATQAGAGLNSNGSYTAISGATFATGATLKAAVTQLDTQLNTTQTDLDTAESSISSLSSSLSGKANTSVVTALAATVDAGEAAVGLETDGSFSANSSGNFISSATTVRGEINALDTQLQTTVGDLSNLSSTVTTLSSAGSTNATEITALENEVDATQAGAGLGTTGAYGANSGSNYIGSATSLKDADDKLDAQIKTNEDDIATNTASIATNTSAIASKAASSTTTAIQTEVDAIETAVGLDSNGGITYTSTPSLFSASDSLKVAVETLDGEIATNAGDILGNANQITAQIALNNTQETAIGLSSTGTYVSRSGTNYLDSASSIVGEITALDTQVKANFDSLATKATAIQLSALDLRVTNAEGDIDDLETLSTTHETNIGLDSDGGYTAISGANYATSGTSLKAAITQLDTQLKTTQDEVDAEETARAAADTTLTTAINQVETSVGLNANGTFQTYSGSNYLDSAATVRAATLALDTQLGTTQGDLDTEEAARAAADATLTTAVNTVEASVGLEADGSLSITGTNFINGQATVVAAVKVLDTNQNLINDIQGNIRTSVGLQTAGTKANYANTNFIGNSDSLKAAIEALDAQVKTNETDISSVSGGSISALQTEVDAIETAAGLSSSGAYVAHSGTNFMDSASTIPAAREALDTKLKTVADDLDTAEAAIVSNDTDIASLQVRGGGLFEQDDDHVIFNDAPKFRGHFGPFQVDLLAALATFPTTFDFEFYGEKAEREGDRHFLVNGDGDITFTGVSTN